MARWRAASLIGVHVLIGLHFAHWLIAGRTLAPVEPSEMFDTLHLGIVTVGFLLMVGLVIATAIAGRFFCGWGCHIMALQDLCAWLLKRLRIPTKPIRSRVLVWVPFLSLLYLFLWPQVERLLHGQPQLSLRVISNPDGWSSFMTTDLLRSFPGPVMTVLTLAVCGFVIVYFLGSRSFCSYACPYGAIFAAAERVSPFRIVAGSGACSQCGLCTASCKSNVRVIEEVRQFGTVVNANCMRDLDCVSVCPTEAIKFGVAKPPALRSWFKPSGLKKRYDFSPAEDVLVAVVFIITLPILRGLYDAIAFLLALALSALIAYAAVLGLRLYRDRRVSTANLTLKQSNTLTPKGQAAALGLILLAAFVLHSGFVRFHVYAGQAAVARTGLDAGAASVAVSGEAEANINTHTRAAIAHLETAETWGLVRPRGLLRQLAVLHQRDGAIAEARRRVNALLAADPDDLHSRAHLAQLWALDGRAKLAEQQAAVVLEFAAHVQDATQGSLLERRLVAAMHCLIGDLHVREGDTAAAQARFEQAVTVYPQQFDAQLALGAMLSNTNRLTEAAERFATCVELNPNSAAAHNNLGAVLVRLGDRSRALEHYRTLLSLVPDQPLGHYNVGSLLMELKRPDEASIFFKKALSLQPDFASAQAGLRKAEQRIAETESLSD